MTNTLICCKIKNAHGGIPKRLKGRAWKARRLVTGCEGSNPSSSAITVKFINPRSAVSRTEIFYSNK